MNKRQLLQRKVAYQHLMNEIKKCEGFSVIEIVDNQNEFVNKYKNLYCKILKNSYPVYASKPFSKNFDENFHWLTTVLPFKNGDEWVLSFSNCDGWNVHIKVISLKKTMYELWWNKNTSITLTDLTNKMILDIGVLETTIDVRVIYFSEQSK